MNFQTQKWDTAFFGFKVAKLKKNCFSDPIEADKIIYELNNNNYFLAYYYSDKQFSTGLIENKFYEIKHVVTRIPLILKLNRDFQFHENVNFYNESYVQEPLNELAVLAGRMGRYGRDKQFLENSIDGIFENWIKNSVDSDDIILTYTIDARIVGMVSFKIDGKKGFGGLMAVYPEFEGRGISFALLRAMMNTLKERGCDYFYSGTQQLNNKALKVFERFGLIPQKPEFVYHLWRKTS